jgi:hypothetical protein
LPGPWGIRERKGVKSIKNPLLMRGGALFFVLDAKLIFSIKKYMEVNFPILKQN